MIERDEECRVRSPDSLVCALECLKLCALYVILDKVGAKFKRVDRDQGYVGILVTLEVMVRTESVWIAFL